MNNRAAQPNKRVYIAFMLIGFLFSLAVTQLLMNWIDFFAAVYDKPNLGYHNLPTPIHYAQAVLRYIVGISMAAVFVIDLLKREFTRTLGYFTGAIFALVVSFIISFVQFAETMSRFD